MQMATLTLRLYDYETLRAKLPPGCRIAILSCGSCARLSDGLGGEQGLTSLAEKLTADGFQVICREVLPIACARDALATLGESGNRLLDEADAVIPLACAAGIRRAGERVPPERLCVVTRTVGKGTFTTQDGARLTDATAETRLDIDTAEGLTLTEAAARLGLHAGGF
jgi:hypothetical protein